MGGDFICAVCHTKFESRNVLFRHLREEHSERKLAEPPSKLWEAERQAAPIVHAKIASNGKSEKKSKQKAASTVEKKELQIETRPHTYREELATKVSAMKELLRRFGGASLPPPEVFESPPEHFRMRVDFDIKWTDDGPRYAMHCGPELIEVEHYPMCCKLICEKMMPIVLQALRDESVLRAQLFQINFHATLHGDAMVSLSYRTPYARAERKAQMLEQGATKAAMGKKECTKLTSEWEAAATRLSNRLSGVSVIGRTRGHKCVVGRLWVDEQLHVAGREGPLRYRQLEGFFSQSNASVCEHMLAWARAVACADDSAVGVPGVPRKDDLLELYCGNGNFCVALAQFFRKVFATEMVKELIDTAKFNSEANGVANIAFGRVSAEELTLAMDGSRKFARLDHVDLNSYDFQTVLVDPPRAGMGPDVCRNISRFPRIVYVSCNPETLRDDLVLLHETHDIVRVAAFDQFAYTDHLEMGVLLVRRTEYDNQTMLSEPRRHYVWRFGVAAFAIASVAFMIAARKRT